MNLTEKQKKWIEKCPDRKTLTSFLNKAIQDGHLTFPELKDWYSYWEACNRP